MALVGIRPEYTLPRSGQRPWGTLVATIPPTIGAGERVWDGVQIVGGQCGDIDRIPTNCTPGEGDETSAIDVIGTPIAFDPFLVYTGLECGILSGLDIGAMTDARLAMSISKQIAEELYVGSETGNPAIIKNPTVIATLNDAGLPACQAIFRLEQELADVTGNLQQIFHVSPAMLSVLVTAECVEREEVYDDMGNEIGYAFYTHNGHLVIGDAGYDGQIPLDENGDPITPQLADGEEFIYVTGPVAWGLGPSATFVDDSGTGYTSRGGSYGGRTNKVLGISQQLALALFDPECVHLAIRATACGDC